MHQWSHWENIQYRESRLHCICGRPVNGEDKGWQSTTRMVRAPRFPRIERALLAGVVLCNSAVADNREEEELDGGVAQQSQGVCNLCLRASQ